MAVSFLSKYASSWLGGWAQLPATLRLLLGGRSARARANYIVPFFACIRLGLNLSFLPYQFGDFGDPGNPQIYLKPYPRLLANTQFVLHLASSTLHVALGVFWFATVGDPGMDEEAARTLTWQKIINFYHLTLTAATIPVLICMWRRAEELKPLLTAPFQMEKWCIEQGGSGGYVSRPMLIVAYLSLNCGANLPLTYIVVTFLYPCLPFMSIWLVASDCPDWFGVGTENLLAKLGFGLLECHFWMFLSNMWLGIGWVTLVYPGSAATRRIEVIARELEAGNMEAIAGFREVQILATLSNNFWRWPLMQISLGEWLITDIVALYTLIKLHSQMPLAILLTVCVVAGNSFTLIHVHMKLVAEPGSASNELFESIKRLQGGGDKWLRRYVRSCSPYRFKISDGRFFDKTTSFVVWEFVVDKLVTCLLMN